MTASRGGGGYELWLQPVQQPGWRSTVAETEVNVSGVHAMCILQSYVGRLCVTVVGLLWVCYTSTSWLVKVSILCNITSLSEMSKWKLEQSTRLVAKKKCCAAFKDKVSVKLSKWKCPTYPDSRMCLWERFLCIVQLATLSATKLVAVETSEKNGSWTI